MPVYLHFQVITPPRFFVEAQFDRAVDHIIVALNGPIAHTLKMAMRKRTQGWNSAPDFKATVQRFQVWNRIALLVEPVGRGRIKWVRNTLGTRPHVIAPRRRKFLRIRPGYNAHTSNPNQYGGPGSYGGAPYKVYGAVSHPGVEARNYEEHIAREEARSVERDLEAAVRRALR